MFDADCNKRSPENISKQQDNSQFDNEIQRQVDKIVIRQYQPRKFAGVGQQNAEDKIFILIIKDSNQQTKESITHDNIGIA